MPTTLTGLLLFIALLLPGFVYVLALRRTRPQRRPSALEEAATIGLVSVVFELIALGFFGVVRTLRPARTPDIGLLIADAGGYLETNYLIAVLWAVGLLAIATGLAWDAGLIIGKRQAHPSGVSSWWWMFDNPPDGYKITVSCMLDDGSWVQGELASSNDSADEGPDRDLILRTPIEYALPGGEQQPFGAGYACVSSRRIITLFVWYTPTSDDEEPRTSSDPDSASAPLSPESDAESGSGADRPRAAAPESPLAPGASQQSVRQAVGQTSRQDHRPSSSDGGYPWSRRSPSQIVRALGSLLATARAMSVRHRSRRPA